VSLNAIAPVGAGKPVLWDRLIELDSHAFGLLVIVFFGVVVFYLFSLQRDFTGTTVALKKMWPDASDHSINRADFLLVSFLGSVVAAVLFNPSTTFEAMMAGLGWVGAINTLGGNK
jgi:hypothetical protein